MLEHDDRPVDTSFRIPPIHHRRDFEYSIRQDHEGDSADDRRASGAAHARYIRSRHRIVHTEQDDGLGGKLWMIWN